MRRWWFLLIAGILIGSGISQKHPQAPTDRVVPKGALGTSLTEATVHRVIDGDTIELTSGARIRYIGIDTPEISDPRILVECFGREAAAENRRLVEGKHVRLEKDISDSDVFGRLLRYVYVADTMINEHLVRNGFALVSTYPPDVKYQERFIAAQRMAREEDAGLWARCPGGERRRIVK